MNGDRVSPSESPPVKSAFARCSDFIPGPDLFLKEAIKGDRVTNSGQESKQPKECTCEENPCPAQFPHPDDDDIFDDSTGDNIGCCNNSCIGDDACELECAEHRHAST